VGILCPSQNKRKITKKSILKMRMNNNMERTVTTIIGTTSEEGSHWSRLIVLVFSGWICKNVLPIFLNGVTALNILKPEITRSDLMGNHCMIKRNRATHAGCRR